MSDDSTLAVQRIHHRDQLAVLINRVAVAFGLGSVVDISVIDVGYEDCNVDVLTNSGRFLVKIFANTRNVGEVGRYVDILRHVSRNAIAHPCLMDARNRQSLFVDEATENHLVVMEYVDGKSFYELGRPPTSDELGLVVEQAVRINALELRPPYLADSWAVQNFAALAEQLSSFMHHHDRVLVDRVMQAMAEVDDEELPTSFVHGDLTKTNVMLSRSGDIHVLDFAVSNTYPRIQELAVIAANLLHDSQTSLHERVEKTAVAYGALNPLTVREREALDAYALGAVAMEFLGALREKCLNNNHEAENEHWLELGRSGLREVFGW